MNGRNYGIDLLRSVSMLMIVILHILGVGGVLAATIPGSWGYRGAWLLETVCMCSVNCFGLVSGYVLSKGRHHYSRLFSLWVRVVLECLVITAAFALFSRGSVTGGDWIKAVTPIYHGVYWYFTAYFALFFFVPYINKMIAALTKREMLVLAGSIIVLFCLLNNITREEIYSLNAGYSFLWLCCLYVLGAVIRGLDIDDSFSWLWLLGCFAASMLLAWVLMLAFQIPRIISYTSPLVLAASVSLLLLFRRIKITGESGKKLVSLLTRTSFGVYIIHTQPLVWGAVLYERFAGFAAAPVYLMALWVLLSAISIYIISTAIDWLAEKLLKLVRLDLAEQKIDIFCDKLTGSRQKTQNTSSN